MYYNFPTGIDMKGERVGEVERRSGRTTTVGGGSECVCMYVCGDSKWENGKGENGRRIAIEKRKLGREKYTDGQRRLTGRQKGR